MSNTTQLQPNKLRQDLLARKTRIGCWSSLGSPITTELLGLAGFDWLLLDAEHAPNDVLSLIPQLMALKDSVSAPVVRPTANDTILIKRLLDAGFYNFLIPFVENAEEAKAAVAATRYPPAGIRGVSVAHRSNRYGTIADYQKVINDNISVIVQIETPGAAAPRRHRAPSRARSRARARSSSDCTACAPASSRSSATSVSTDRAGKTMS